MQTARTPDDRVDAEHPSSVTHAERHAALQREDRKVVEAGQRRINLIWEVVQAYIAVLVITIALTASAVLLIKDPTNTVAQAAFLFITNMASLIVGFYFSRTNHTAIGGTGSKVTAEQPYIGR